MRVIHILTALAVALAAPAIAAIGPGAKAPDFTTQAALGGKEFQFSLAKALQKGPVVLYFFPAAFTPGCTMEAHQFAEATADFQKAGATIVGVAADKIDDLKRFSVSECRNKFAVAVATPAMVSAYQVALPQLAGRSDRTSFVIAPNGTVAYAFSAMDYRDHMTNTLKAVQNWKAAQRRK